MVIRVMPYQLKVYGLTDVGLVRKNNEDLWAELPEINTYVLADGMGGHQAGEVAASQAVIALCEYMKKMLVEPVRSFTIGEMRSEIEYAIQRVNAKVYKMGYRDAELKGMGTTLCCLHLHPDGMIHAHVGDSRIYLYRENILSQLTEDHSLAREMINLGQLEERDVKKFSYKNIITKAVGTEPYVDPSVHIGDVKIGDVYLMCSDGLSDFLNDREIEGIISKGNSLKEIANRLIDAAKDKGGHDNITVVLLNVQEDRHGREDLS
jgi:PPM family protein phosphatase